MLFWAGVFYELKCEEVLMLYFNFFVVLSISDFPLASAWIAKRFPAHKFAKISGVKNAQWTPV